MKADAETAERAAAELLSGWHRRLRPVLPLRLFHKRRKGASTIVEVHIVEPGALPVPFTFLFNMPGAFSVPRIFAESCALANFLRKRLIRVFHLRGYDQTVTWLGEKCSEMSSNWQTKVKQ